MNRRNFLGVLFSGAVGMAFMPTMLFRQRRLILWSDGVHDDTVALQAWFNGKAVYRPNGEPVPVEKLHDGHFLISKTIDLRGSGGKSIFSSWFEWRGAPPDPIFLSEYPKSLR